jgi:hypothetical protein
MPVSSDYHLFGLQIRSGMALPELQRNSFGDDVDVLISIGQLPADAPSSPGAHVHDGSVVLTIEDVARYAISEGRQILIEPA